MKQTYLIENEYFYLFVSELKLIIKKWLTVLPPSQPFRYTFLDVFTQSRFWAERMYKLLGYSLALITPTVPQIQYMRC